MICGITIPTKKAHSKKIDNKLIIQTNPIVKHLSFFIHKPQKSIWNICRGYCHESIYDYCHSLLTMIARHLAFYSLETSVNDTHGSACLELLYLTRLNYDILCFLHAYHHQTNHLTVWYDKRFSPDDM